MGRRPKKYMPFVSIEERIDRVRNMVGSFPYGIPDIIRNTGWSASQIYNLMSDSTLPFFIQGCHRKVLGKHVQSVFFNKV